MKLMVLLIALSISSSSWSFVSDKNFSKRIVIFEKNEPSTNSGIILKSNQRNDSREPAQHKQNLGRTESQQYNGGNLGEWKVLRKAEPKID